MTQVSLPVVATPPASTASAEPVTKPRVFEWLTSEPEGRRIARDEHRPTVIVFCAAWSAACRELDQTLSDATVRAEASRFVAIRIDVTDDENDAVSKVEGKYRVDAVPALTLIDRKGVERARFSALMSPARLVEALRAVE